MGIPSIFIRLSGCNLRCEFCDSRLAWTQGTELSWPQIAEKIRDIHKKFPASWVCLTGGEPFAQDITSLTSRLRKEGFSLQIETNAILHQPVEVDWLTISPKPPDFFIHPGWVKKADEAKLIVTRELRPATVKKVRETLPPRTPVLLQPQSNLKWSMDKAYIVLEKSLSAGLENIRLSIQMHKVYDIR